MFTPEFPLSVVDEFAMKKEERIFGPLSPSQVRYKAPFFILLLFKESFCYKKAAAEKRKKKRKKKILERKAAELKPFEWAKNQVERTEAEKSSFSRVLRKRRRNYIDTPLKRAARFFFASVGGLFLLTAFVLAFGKLNYAYAIHSRVA